MLKKMRGALRGSEGFTMIELLVVLAVLGILAAVAVPKFTDMTSKANTVKAKTELKTVQTGMEMYFAANDSYPTSEDTLTTVLSDYVKLDSLTQNYNFTIATPGTDESYHVDAEYYEEGIDATDADLDATFAITNNSITETE